MKTVLITGASSGIGKETAKTLLAEGYVVYAAARRVDQMKDLEKLGGHLLKMDVTQEDDLVASVDLINEQHGGVDILINNAGFGMYGAMEDTTLEDARYQFDVNVFGLARLTQLVLPRMREKKEGKIVNVSSMGGKVYTPLGSWYHASKHALEGWSDCLRLELKQFGVDVIIIEPGIIQSEFGDVLMGPMLERSGEGPYGDLAQHIAKGTQESYEKGGASPASLIAKLIAKSIGATKPKTRYVAGKYAKLSLFIRKWFGDRFYDRMIMRMI